MEISPARRGASASRSARARGGAATENSPLPCAASTRSAVEASAVSSSKLQCRYIASSLCSCFTTLQAQALFRILPRRLRHTLSACATFCETLRCDVVVMLLSCTVCWALCEEYVIMCSVVDMRDIAGYC